MEFGNRDNDPVAVVMAFGATDHEAHVGAPPSWLGPSLRMHSCRKEAGAQPLGIHLEGPYLDPERRGAFPPELLREPNVDEMEDYLRAAKGYIRIVTLAPNLPHSRSVARRLHQRGVLASLGHSNASYEEAASALSEDFPLVTHVFNAMSGLHHRKPGVVGAVLTSERAMGMLICDGVHVHPAAEACS